MVCGGTNTTISTQANQNFLSGKLNLAKPYPTSVQTEICRTAMVKETTREFTTLLLYAISSAASL